VPWPLHKEGDDDEKIRSNSKEGSMRAGNVLAFAMAFALAAPVLAQGPGEAKAKSAPKAAASRLVVTPASEVKWADLDPTGASGVKIADLWGNHTTGAYGAFFKLPAGFAAPLHTHTHDIKVVIVSGTYIQSPERKPEFRLGPGSYFMQPGGNYRHTTSCDKASLPKATESSISSWWMRRRHPRRSRGAQKILSAPGE
jgi:quercetin dioxygenase-like cupin family protein